MYLFILFLILFSDVIQAGVYVEGDLFAYSEPVSVIGALNNWKGSFNGGDVALTHNSLEVGWSKDNYKIGFIHRYDSEMEFSPDTAEIAYRIKNKIPLELNRTYRLDLSVRHTYSQGVHIRYKKTYNQRLTFTAGLSILQGLTLTEGRLSGQATTVSESDYDFQFDVNYYYSKDYVLKQKAIAPNGYGFSSDLFVNYQYNRDLSIDINIVDLFGLILWVDTPKTIGHANSENKTIDEDGWVTYQPTLEGKKTHPEFLQILLPVTTLTGIYAFNQISSLTARLYYTDAFTFIEYGTRFSHSSSRQLQLSYIPKLKAITLGANTKSFLFSITSDQFEFHKSHILSIKFGFGYAF